MIKLDVKNILLFSVIIFLLYHLIKLCKCGKIEFFSLEEDGQGNQDSPANPDDMGKQVYFLFISNEFITNGNIFALTALLKNITKVFGDLYDFSNELKDTTTMCILKNISDQVLANGGEKHKKIDKKINELIEKHNNDNNIVC